MQRVQRRLGDLFGEKVFSDAVTIKSDIGNDIMMAMGCRKEPNWEASTR